MQAHHRGAPRAICHGFCAAALTFVFLASPLAHASRLPPNAVEVMHWLTSSRDAKALSVLRKAFILRGGRWIDSPMPGAGEVGRTAAVNRIVGGKPPAIFQFSIGAQLQVLAQGEVLAAVPNTDPKWSAALPLAINQASRNNGQLIAAPLDIRGENWLFYNRAILRAAHVQVPETWPDLLTALKKVKAAGKIPLALGGQPWQEGLIFNDIVLGVGGTGFYRSVFEQMDPKAIASPTMLTAFRTFGALRPYVDSASTGRRWNQATLMVIRGDAAFQFMGDWAKDEILSAGLVPGADIGCVLTPAPSQAYVMQVDAFVFSQPASRDQLAGQRLFAQTLSDPAVLDRFAKALGAIPARNDITPDGYDACSTLAMKIIRNPQAQLLDFSLRLPSGLAGAIEDSVAQFWSDAAMTPEQGRAHLLNVVRSYRQTR
jgi:glucose/mannose transport system substrate-binding protein